MNGLDSAFNTFCDPETYHRVDGSHPLDLYIGIDRESNWTMLLICDFELPVLKSSRMISVQTGKRSDGQWALSLTLVDDSYKDIFLLLCNDIIDSARAITSRKKAAGFIAKRYNEWREMLANARGNLLSVSEAKGLLGEMYFLQKYLALTYGIDKAALSWTGPMKLHQDFIIDDTWFEVKTVSSTRSEVLVSSIEQLDCENPGELVVIRADRTSTTNENRITLNIVYNQLLAMIVDDSVKSEFSNMLFRFGYFPRPEYDTAEYTYEIKDVQRYSVDLSFPCMRRNSIPESITDADYSLSLPSIASYRKE